ncbi:MAG: acetate--CoA ligase family protein [Sporichthyaceae bacterium]|nr:acetate--CoA ligase family protein [Sporichthyaceae bacterium]
MRLDRLMAPTSIAVVGASPRAGTYGNQALANLVAAGYSGRLFGVHPSPRVVHGVECVPSLADLPGPVDAVVIATPAATVAGLVDQAGELGCGGAVVFAAGFAEVEHGRSLQDAVVAAARRHDLPVCGPNGNGIIALEQRAILWGDAFHPRPAGSVALVSQSGNVAVNAIAARRGLLLHTVVSGGNQAVLDAADYLDYLAAAPGVRSVALYLENDCDGARLASALATCVEHGTGVVVLKAGQSALGRSAAAAHTGAVAGDARILRALVEEAGGAWARNPHELLELAKTLAVHRPGSGGPGTAVVTCSGGDAATAADQAEELGVSIPALSPATARQLEALLPAAATAANPVDYTALIWGEADPIAGILEVVGADPAIDQILVYYDRPLGMDAAMTQSWDGTLDGIIAGAGRTSVPVVVASTLPELLDEPSAFRLAATGIAPVAGLTTGLVCAAALAAGPGSADRLHAVAAAATTGRDASQREWLAEHAAKALLEDAGIPVPAGQVVDSVAAAVAAADKLGYPVGLKLSAPDLLHKSDIGALALGLADGDAVRTAYTRLRALPARHGAVVLVEQMAEPGVELLVAARRDGVVPSLVVGLGGIWVELLADVAVIPLPAEPERIEHALARLAGASLLRGGRGREPVDLGAVARLAASVGALLLDQGLDLIELNPVIARPDGAVAVDALIRR